MNDYNGIIPYFEVFYIHSVIYAAERCEAAFCRFDQAAYERAGSALIVSTLQEALTHAGDLSRFFWPMEKGRLTKARGLLLRNAFSLNDSSALKSRDLRNTFEHFDERLDQYLLKNHVGCFFPDSIVGSYTLASSNIGRVFKLVDPQEGKAVILGKVFDFLPIREAVCNVLIQAVEMSDQGGRLRR